MTWVEAHSWNPDVIDHAVALHDLEGGTVVVPAPPRRQSERGALLTILSGLGKDVVSHGAPKARQDTRDVTSAWLAGEQVRSVILLSAQRWRVQEIQTVAEVINECGAQLIPFLTAPPLAALRNFLQERFGQRSGPETLSSIQQVTSLRPLDPRLAPLRSYRLPHILSLAAGALAGIDAGVLIELPCSAHQGHDDVLMTPTGVVGLPAGAGRVLHAQKTLSRLNRSDRLLSIYGRPLRPVDASWAALRVLGDHDLDLPIAAA